MQIITRPLTGVPSEAGVQFSSRERSRLVLSVILTVLVVAGLVFSIIAANGTPDLGLTIGVDTQGHKIIASVQPYAPGYDLGIQAGDLVLSDSYQGAVRTITVARSNDPFSEITATSGDVPQQSALQRWIFIVLALIFVGVGGPVYVKARHRVAASAFYALCLATALCLIIEPLTYLSTWWTVLLMALSLMVWSSCFAFFFLKFPVRAGKTRQRHRLLVLSVYVTGFLTISAYLLIFNFDLELYPQARILNFAYLAFGVLLGLLSLGRAFFREHSPEVRQQMTIILGGTALAVVPTLLLGIFPQFLGLDGVPVDFTALTLGIMPLAFAYAITQGQLLGMRNFIRRGLVYALMAFGVLLAFALGVLALPDGWQQSEVGIIGFSLFVFLIALSYGYVQKFVERMVDKYIYHDAYDYKEALLNFSAHLAAEQNLPTLADELVQRTCRMMNLSCGVLLLAAAPDKDATLQAELLLNDMSSTDVDLDAVWGALRQNSHTNSLFDDYAGNSDSPADWNTLSAELKHSAGNPNEGDPTLRVVPYARYGEFADWLIEGLHYELSQLGIRLDRAEAPMQMIYFHQHTGDLDGNVGTWRHQTQPLREDGLSGDKHANMTGTLHNNGVSTSVSTSYLAGRPGGSASAMNTGGLSRGNKSDAEAIRSFLGVPLWTRSRFVGVLCLGGKSTGERFTRDDVSLLSTLGSQAALAIYNAQLYEAREQALLDTIGALAHAIEAKDGYTIQHCENMTGRAVALAQAMGLSTKEVENIRMGAILHDIGKIGIPDAVLNKPGKLTADEYELMKQHAAIGARIVQSVGALQGVVPIVRYHQERYDGSGYPEGLKGEAIPIGARIIGVVDTYGAMTEDRVYRATPGHRKAVEELQRLAGKQFDPTVVEAFIRLLEERPDLAEHRSYIA
jgi:putative nucleotidyltransferase with HDIG domain